MKHKNSITSTTSQEADSNFLTQGWIGAIPTKLKHRRKSPSNVSDRERSTVAQKLKKGSEMERKPPKLPRNGEKGSIKETTKGWPREGLEISEPTASKIYSDNKKGWNSNYQIKHVLHDITELTRITSHKCSHERKLKVKFGLNCFERSGVKPTK